MSRPEGYLNHPLLQGPKRINGPRKRLEPAKLRAITDEEKAALEIFRAEGNTYARIEYVEEPTLPPLKSGEIPEPTDPRFDSKIHGLLAPPKTKYIRRYD